MEPWPSGLLVVEVKNLVVDLQDLLSVLDRKRRLAPRLARELGWQPLVVGTVLVLPDEKRARNAVSAHRVLRAALPSGTWQVVRWLRAPRGDIRGIWFVSDSGRIGSKAGWRGSARVRRPTKMRPSQAARSDKALETG